MHVSALKVLDDAGFEGLSVGQFDDADGRGFESGQLRRPVAPRSGDDLEVLAHGSHNERRKDALRFDGLGQFAKRRLIEAAARVGSLPARSPPRRHNNGTSTLSMNRVLPAPTRCASSLHISAPTIACSAANPGADIQALCRCGEGRKPDGQGGARSHGNNCG